jgi:hypothetical protein
LNSSKPCLTRCCPICKPSTEFLKLSPKQQKKGGPWLGTGYWALEVAALAVLYGWDDSALRASPYPADLADYARGRLAQTESGDF